jgi:hypothetical protein
MSVFMSVVNTVLEIKFVKRLWIKQYLGLQKVDGTRISKQSVYEGGKVVSPRHRLPLPLQEVPLVLISVRG